MTPRTPSLLLSAVQNILSGWDQAGGAGPEAEDLLVRCIWVPPGRLPHLREECDLGVLGQSEY